MENKKLLEHIEKEYNEAKDKALRTTTIIRELEKNLRQVKDEIDMYTDKLNSEFDDIYQLSIALSKLKEGKDID